MPARLRCDLQVVMATRNSKHTHILLAGAGDVHLLVLRMLRREEIRDARVTLLSDVTHVFYAPMLSGVVGGRYGASEALIDLPKLCASAGVDFVQGAIKGLSLSERYVSLAGDIRVPFRLLSLDLGSRPSFSNEPTVKAFAVMNKPVELFLLWWDEFVRSCKDSDRRLLS